MSSSLAVFHTMHLAGGVPGPQVLLDQLNNTGCGSLLGWFLNPSSLSGTVDTIYIYYFLAFESEFLLFPLAGTPSLDLLLNILLIKIINLKSVICRPKSVISCPNFSSLSRPSPKVSHFPDPPTVYEAFTSSFSSLISHYTDAPLYIFPFPLALSSIRNNHFDGATLSMSHL
jgi:hypothetical protein